MAPASSTHDAALRRLGWDEDWSTVLAAADVPAGRTLARVVRTDRRSYDLLVPGPGGVAPLTAPASGARVRAATLDPRAAAATGDWVLVDVGAPEPVVDLVLPRRSAVVRAAVDRSSRSQVLAANVDVVAVVEGMVPDLDHRRVERLLALAWSSGGRPLILLTKADLVADPTSVVREVAHVAPGVEVVATSAPTGAGLGPVRDVLRGGATVALLGASGAGKSTVLNSLLGEEQRMRTAVLRSDGKGRHTTVTRELHLAPDGGAVVDTPGLRTVGLAGDATPGGSLDAVLSDVFADVEELALGCRFGDCAHRSEPGCAVRAAVEDGTLSARRLENHRLLLREAAYQAARTDARLRAQRSRELKARARAHRHHPGRP